MKSLVVYFSRGDENYNVGSVEVGNTELLAKEIVSRVGADEFKVVPVNPYPSDYQETVEIATKEVENGLRPEYAGDVDISEYDTIFLGYPIWWGDWPMIMYTFIEKHDFSGKTIIPFNTHEGSGNSGTYAALQAKIPGAEFKGDGFNMSGKMARTEEGLKKIDKFLEGLEFPS